MPLVCERAMESLSRAVLVSRLGSACSTASALASLLEAVCSSAEGMVMGQNYHC